MAVDPKRKINIAILISGRGSNMKALVKACQDDAFPARVALVLSNNPEAQGLAYAEAQSIQTEIVDHKNYKGREAFERAMLAAIGNYEIDLICLAGFMRILTPNFIKPWTGRILNTHPSLLPKFGGEGMYGENVHRAVLDAKEQTSGASIHFVTEGVDEGEVITQKSVPVLKEDTIETLSKRVLEQEHKAYPEAVKKVANQLLQN